MKLSIFLSLLLLTSVSITMAQTSSNLFAVDQVRIARCNSIGSNMPSSATISLNHPNNRLRIDSKDRPSNLMAFGIPFVSGLVGTYLIYGAFAGPVALAGVYLYSDGNKSKTWLAAWGCGTGMLIGGGIKYLIIK